MKVNDSDNKVMNTDILRAVGKTLIRLLDEVLKDPSLNTKEQLLDLIS